MIAYPLFLIFSKSLESGTLPSDWKLAAVTEIYKKSSKTHRENYRPVSLTSVCCKILESLIRDHIMNYLLENSLLNSKQYVFVKGRSTTLSYYTGLINGQNILRMVVRLIQFIVILRRLLTRSPTED